MGLSHMRLSSVGRVVPMSIVTAAWTGRRLIGLSWLLSGVRRLPSGCIDLWRGVLSCLDLIP